MVMLLEGRHLQFFVHKKLDPSSCNVKFSRVLQRPMRAQRAAVGRYSANVACDVSEWVSRVKRGIMSTLTLITNFGQINAVKKFKLDLIECLYIYAVIHNIK